MHFAVTVFIALASLSATAQITIDPTYLSIADGLTSPNVQDVIQDSYGLIWIATNNGVQRYDGYSFQTFKNVSGKPGSLLNNNAWDLIEDKAHNIWVAHDLGVSRYDRDRNEFTNYRFSNYFNVPAAGTPGRTFTLIEDRTGRLLASTGFMEVVTFDADSNKWEFYPYDVAEEKLSLAHYGQSFSISEGPTGIWAGSSTFGLIYLAPNSKGFKPVPPNILGIDLTQPEKTISSLYADSAQTVWFTTRSGVYRYYPQQQTLKTIRTYTEALNDGWNNWNAIQADAEGNIWVANNFRGALKINPSTNEAEDVLIAGRTMMKGHGWNLTFTDFTIDRSGIFWFGTRELGILKYDPVRKPFTYYANDPANPKGIPPNGVFGLMASRVNPGLVYVGSRGGWFSTLDPKTQTFEKHSYTVVDDLYGGSVRAFLEESDGSLWLGTWGDGLIKVDPELREVRRYKNNPADPGSLSNNQIRSIKRDGKGRLWVGTNFGLNVLDPKSGKIERIASKTTQKYPAKLEGLVSEPLVTHKVIAIIDKVVDYQDIDSPISISESGRYVLVSAGEGDPGGMADFGWITNSSGDTIWTAKTYSKSFNAGGAPKNRIQIGLVELSKGNYVLHYHSDDSHSYDHWNETKPTFEALYGTAILKPSGAEQLLEIERLLTPAYELLTLGPGISDIEVDSKFVWVGQLNGGLNKIDPVSNTATYFKHDPTQSNSLSSDNVTGLFSDTNGILWVTTSEGLNRLDPATNNILRFGESDGLPTNLTEGIVEGDDGQLWIATQNGLSQMIANAVIGKPTFINFHAVDGLGTDVFLSLTCDRSPDGHFYFGGDHGLTTFQNITPNKTPPAIILSNLLVSNQSVQDVNSPIRLSASLLDTRELTLAFDQNNLSFEFAALHFTNPKRNQYAHFLKGYDKDWVYDNRNFASYTNLDPGQYEFIIRASNANGIWNEQGHSLKITIQPPWWRTWWAYSSYVCFFGFSIFTTDRFMRGRIKRKERERGREKELAQAKEIEKAYNDLKATQTQLIQSEKMASLGELTAGIAHEIQNPLNFVNNFSEINKELLQEMNDELTKGNLNEAKKLAGSVIDNEEKIIFHGKRADSIVKGMLLHSRASSGLKEPTDINALADEYLRLAYHGLRAQDKSFTASMKTEFDASLGKVSLVPQDMGRVILNLITNAFHAVTERKKESTNGYDPTVTVTTGKLGNKIVIKVSDNGKGIPPHILDKIFQPFFTTKPSGKGTGLGLSMSYDIVTKVHNGQIDVDTKLGEGTSFIITIPNSTP